MRSTILRLAFWLPVAANLFAQRPDYGEAFRINNDTAQFAYSVKVAMQPDGSMLICWGRRDGELSCKIYDHEFDVVRDDFVVNPGSAPGKGNHVITTLADNKYVICWVGFKSGADIYGQVIDRFGNNVGPEFRVNTYTPRDQNAPTVATLSDSRVIVVWQSDRQSQANGWELHGQIFDSTGGRVGGEFSLPTRAYGWLYPEVQATKDGGFLLVWQDYQPNTGLFGQFFDASLQKVGAEFQLSQTEGTYVTITNDGTLLACWPGIVNSSQLEIFCRKFSAAGEPLGDVVQVNLYSWEGQSNPRAISLDTGMLVICWDSRKYGGRDIYGQLFDPGLNKIGTEFVINSVTEYWHSNSCLLPMQNGDFFVGWSTTYGNDQGDVFGKFYKQPEAYRLSDFRLLQPEHNSELDTISPLLVWSSPVTNEVYPWEIEYEVHVDVSADFTDPTTYKAIQDTSFRVPGLLPGRSYFWKIKAVNLSGDSLWSTDQYFEFKVRSLFEDGDSWRMTNGPFTGRIRALHYANGYIFAGTHGNGMFRSGDEGDTWRAINTNLNTDAIRDITSGPHGKILLSSNNGIFLSDNNGDSWRFISSSLTRRDSNPIAFGKDGEIFAGDTDGVYMTLDEGGTWQRIGVAENGSGPFMLSISPTGRLFASHPGDIKDTGVLSFTDDNGASWHRTKFRCYYATRLAFGLNSGIFGISSRSCGQYTASDGSGNWQGFGSKYLARCGRERTDLITDQRGNPIVANDEGICYSKDDGQTWVTYSSGLLDARMEAIAIGSNGNIYIGGQDGIVYQNAAVITDVAANRPATPKRLSLEANYPNPFNATTTFSFWLPERSDVELQIYNLLGKSVYTQRGVLPAGQHRLIWEAANLPSGIYFVRLKSGGHSQAIKICLQK